MADLTGRDASEGIRDAMLLELVFFAMGAVILWCVIRSALSGGVRDALKDVELWKRSLDD